MSDVAPERAIVDDQDRSPSPDLTCDGCRAAPATDESDGFHFCADCLAAWSDVDAALAAQAYLERDR